MKSVLRVLYIEDNESDAELVTRHLAKGGYDVYLERVEYSETLIEAIEKKQWDIVFSDYQLPSLNAPEAYKIFKSFNLNIPFILISGAIGEEAAVRMIKLGVNDYVMKNNMALLPEVVKRELEEALLRKNSQEDSQELKKVALGELSGNYFKSNLEYLLESNGIKQSQLARDTGISKQTISDWLNRDTLVNIQQAFKLTRYFNITIENLIVTNLKSLNEIKNPSHIVSEITAPLQVLSYDLQLMTANKSFCDLVGFSEYELNSRIYTDIIHPDDVLNIIISFKKIVTEGINTFTTNLRCFTTQGSFRWLNSVVVNSPSERKIYIFSTPLEIQPNENLFKESIVLEKIISHEFERIQSTTFFKKLSPINEIDPKLTIQTDRAVLRCLIRSLYLQIASMDFETKDKFEVLLRSRVEDEKVIVSATINCIIHPKILDINRVKKVANAIGLDIAESYAGNLYSFYLSFPKNK